MRTLRFIVNGQIIDRDPTCDFSNLVPGTTGYLQAEFKFSSDWAGYKKVAGFWSATGKEYPPQVLENGSTCMIPAEALTRYAFKVSVLGSKRDLKLTTNKVAVVQNGGAK